VCYIEPISRTSEKQSTAEIRVLFRQEETTMNQWLTSLQTATPQEGFELAITLSRKGVAYTQPSAEIREKLRPHYAEDADSLIAGSQVVAINFQTVAAANNYWK